jgi:sortase A
MSAVRRIERVLWVLGAVLLASYGGIRLYQSNAARRGVQSFLEKAGNQPLPASRPTPADAIASFPRERILLRGKPPDMSLWSSIRVREYQESFQRDSSDPVAVLRIPKFLLEVPVFAGTADFALNRGVGWIEGTAPPGAEGNSGIAGHRDGFFRPLKDISRGDAIELLTLSGIRNYQVATIQIVSPDDIQVLDPAPQATLTLVSCYPFYFVGSAPRRFIVRAVSSAPEAEAVR